MKKFFILILIYILVTNCSYQPKDQSLDDLKKIIQDEIEQSLMNFDRRYALDPAKAAKAHYIAYNLNDNFKLIYSQIDSDNPSRDSIQKYFQTGLSYYGIKNLENNPTLKNRVEMINQSLNNKSEMQIIDFLICELENVLLSKTYQEIDINAYKFNELKAIPVPVKTEIKLGETYEAKIYIAAFDTTRYPRITFRKEYNLPVEEGFGMLRIKGTSKGQKRYSGNIEWSDGGSIKVNLPYDIEFTVK